MTTMTDTLAMDESSAEAFVIDSPGKANWAVQEVKDKRNRRDIFVQAAQETIARMQEQIREVTNKCDRDTEYLLCRLDEYLDSAPVKKAKTQISLDLPAGKLVRKFPSTDYVRDDKALIETLKETDYVKTEPSLQWGELKKDLLVSDGAVILSTTGEVLEGIAVVEKPATFDVK